ncbi:DUF1127 domain-containing protein [Rhodopseudomonas palustris]|uniref:DUF1127 domain-containing protein n=1 Tax=Rhodopseudomonas palustris TaxID=1076 RepID=A0A418VHC9_RHOPL|nr:DUF1127 domain-containing protein [Rhodopseudomonas palustris]RJF75444.1 DUF1127 domain-containing protein [Rhodopseudomonas palustris]
MSICTDHSMTNNHASGVLTQVAETVRLWRQRQHDRDSLARLSERDLHDVGLSWSEAAAEVDKPFWRA